MRIKKWISNFDSHHGMNSSDYKINKIRIGEIEVGNKRPNMESWEEEKLYSQNTYWRPI